MPPSSFSRWPLPPLFAAVVFLSFTASWGELVTYDGFGGYAGGGQLESGANGSPGMPVDGGFGWGGPYDVNNAIKSLIRAEGRTANPIIYENDGVFLHGGDRALRLYDNANGGYAAERSLGRTFSATADQTLWFSFLFRTNNSSPLANRDYFQVGFDDNDDADAGTPRVGIGATTILSTFPPSQAFRFFAKSTTDNANTAFAAIDIAASTTYFLVGRRIRIRDAYDTVGSILNPVSSDTPGHAQRHRSRRFRACCSFPHVPQNLWPRRQRRLRDR